MAIKRQASKRREKWVVKPCFLLCVPIQKCCCLLGCCYCIFVFFVASMIKCKWWARKGHVNGYNVSICRFLLLHPFKKQFFSFKVSARGALWIFVAFISIPLSVFSLTWRHATASFRFLFSRITTLRSRIHTQKNILIRFETSLFVKKFIKVWFGVN